MTEKFENIKVYSGEELAKPAPTAVSTGMASEQSQAVAKIQAALTIAAARPRDELTAIGKIVKSCQRKKVAESAEYAYKRKNTMIVGPSIKLAQIIASHWGNLRYGFREIGGGPGYVEVEAFAWDLESNTETTRQFRVYHRRYTGGDQLDSERDKYENMASQSQRRVRACLQQVIPDDVFETAREECAKTIKRSDPRSTDEKVRAMAAAFAEIGVTRAELEGFLGNSLNAVVEPQIVTLRRVYTSISDGAEPREAFFGAKVSAVEEAKKKIEQAAVSAEPKSPEAEKPPKQRKPRSDKGKSRKQQTELDQKIEQAAAESEAESEEPESPDTASQLEINPIEELYGLADQMWGNEAGSNLNATCTQHGVDLATITTEQASAMIDVLANQ